MLPNWSLSGLVPCLPSFQWPGWSFSVHLCSQSTSGFPPHGEWWPHSCGSPLPSIMVPLTAFPAASNLQLLFPLSLLFLKECLRVHLAVAGVFWSTCPLDLPMIHSFMIWNITERPSFWLLKRIIYLFKASSLTCSTPESSLPHADFSLVAPRLALSLWACRI